MDIGFAESGQIGNNQIKVIFKQWHNRLPDCVVERVAMDEHQRRPFSTTLEGKINSVNEYLLHISS
jgi:hypothetical protein